MSILRTYDLSIGYKNGSARNEVMGGINLSLHRGKLTALLGSNGIGKSTLIRTLSGAQPVLEGTVEIDGVSIENMGVRLRSTLLSLVYTDRSMIGGLTVRELVSLGRHPHTGFLGRLDDNDKRIVCQAVSDVGITHKIDSYVSELSDGERQKAMIAKALAQETPIIILDEPTAFLDVESRIETLRLLVNLAHRADKAILVSTHDVAQTLLHADELWVITNGHKMLCGVTEDLVLNGAMDELFSSEGICFNLINGDYEVSMPIRKHISLKCGNNEIGHWIISALKRNGIDVQENCEDHIEVVSKSEIILNGTHKVTSIGDLINCLKD